jgi:hypothetical protein
MARATECARLAVLLALATACDRTKVNKCHELMEASQPIVSDVAPNSLESVERAAGAVQAALIACQDAEREEETAQLSAAHQKFQGHLAALRERLQRESARQLSPAELERLVQRGDADCPRGQAYKHRDSGKEIRCTGPHPIQMGQRRAARDFERRGYKLIRSDDRASVVAEYGAEKVVFEYAKDDDRRPPRCATVYPPPGMSWQEAVARLTGVSPLKLEMDEPVATAAGELPLQVVEKGGQVTLSLGACAASQ